MSGTTLGFIALLLVVGGLSIAAAATFASSKDTPTERAIGATVITIIVLIFAFSVGIALNDHHRDADLMERGVLQWNHTSPTSRVPVLQWMVPRQDHKH